MEASGNTPFWGGPVCQVLRGEAGAATAALGGVGVDEVEALAHEGLFEVEDHAGEVDEALGVDEDTDGGVGGVVEDEGAVALTGLGVEADVVAEAGAAAALDAEARATLLGGDVFFGPGGADAFEGLGGEADALGGSFGRHAIGVQ